MTNAKNGLAAYLEAAKSADPLYGEIQRHVMKKTTEQSDRRVDCIHPSEAVKDDWCVRGNYYRITTNILHNPRTTNFRLENIFQEGHNTHSKWQGWLAEMGRLEGDWKCHACGSIFYANAPKQCHECYGPIRNLVYEELKLVNDDLMISGRTDGYIPSHNRLLEIKTMGYGGLKWEQPEFVADYEKYMNGKSWVALENLWRDFRRPLRSARRQGQLYLWLAREKGLPVDEIQFIYDFKATQDSKSFIVQYNPEVIEDILGNCQTIVDAVRAGHPPLCNVNASGCASCRPYEEEVAA